MLVAVAGTASAQTPPTGPDLDETLARVGERVLTWYARAQSIVARETVSIQPLRSDLLGDGAPRRLAYELRLEWDEGEAAGGVLPEATILRQLLTVNGRPPRDRDAGCMDPKPVSPEPLAMLLPSRRDAFRFELAGTGQVNGREALMIDYEGAEPGTPDIAWNGECVSITLPGRSAGRIWVDAGTYDVLRLDERLTGLFDFTVPDDQVRRGASPRMTIERADTSIRYRYVEFDNPRETLLLPDAIDTLTIVRGGGIQRHRIMQRFTDYRRFLTGGRMIVR